MNIMMFIMADFMKKFFKKIIFYSFSPNILSKRILNILLVMFFNTFAFLNGYKKRIISQQENNFFKNKLNRMKSINKLEEIKLKHPFLNDPMSSEHQVLFSGIALSKINKISNILEIGTYDGKNAFLLSQLFPNASITTLDLKDDDLNFKNSYNRYNSFEKFTADRNNILKLSKNIIFIQKNSLFLTHETKRYDLIWIDGAHGYPVVTIDIANSLRLISKSGLVMCDDVFTTKLINKDSMYSSDASYNTLQHLRNAKLLDYDLFFKRLSLSDNSNPFKRKYIALIKLKN